ncbi:hypothetical protein [Klebsiella pneumoniae IS22]|nr:hypothetical protein [Klebsiella pneumoniae IS22]
MRHIGLRLGRAEVALAASAAALIWSNSAAEMAPLATRPR